MKQILINLISNSFKFTNQGKIHVSISSYKERDFERSERFLKIIVEDSGIGISDQDKASLFKLFGIVHKHREKLNMRGTGLGLTISQKLVELLGGEIQLESEENVGTIVTLTIKESPQDDNDPDLNQFIQNML